MKNRFALLLSALTLTLAASSCKHNFSKDDPLPEVYTNSIYISSQNQFVYALEPATGTKKWEFNAGGNVSATPLSFNNNLYIATTNGFFYKLDPNHGTIRNSRSLFTTLYSSPVGDGSMVYFGAGDDSLAAIDANTLETKWKFGTGGAVVGSPVVFKDRIITASLDGKVYAINKTTGAQIWVYDAGSSAAFYSSPSVDAKFIYVGGGNGILYALDLEGNLKWSYITTQTGSPIKSSPIAYGGNVIFGAGDYKLYCIDTQAHAPRWTLTTGDRIISTALAYNQVIYVGSYDYYFYAVNILDGAIKWKYKTGALIESSPLGYNGKVYFGSDDKYLYEMDTATGNVNWKQNINGLIETSPVVYEPNGKSYHPGNSGMNN